MVLEYGIFTDHQMEDDDVTLHIAMKMRENTKASETRGNIAAENLT